MTYTQHRCTNAGLARADFAVVENSESGEAFRFTSKPRTFEKVEVQTLRWPKKATLANELVEYWHELAGSALASLNLSKATLNCIASHVSRRDGVCTMTDRQIALRTGRSVGSTKRDVSRLKQLGFVVAEIQPGKGGQKRVRVLKLAHPDGLKKSQRIPPAFEREVVSTYAGYVETYDNGER